MGHRGHDCGADLHRTFTTSGQFVALFTVGRRTVGDKRSVPVADRLMDRWKSR